MRRVLFVFALALTLCLSACSSRQSGEQISIALVANSPSDFRMIGKAGGEKAAKELGVSFELRTPWQATATEQKTILEDLASKGVTGVAISPIDPANQTDTINKACQSMLVLCTDSDAPDSERICYIGTDNYSSGKIAGEQLMKILPDGGKVWACVGTMDAQNARDRYKGLQDAVSGSNINLLGVMTDNIDRTKAKANVEDALVKSPDLAAFVGLWSYNGPAIADAVKAAKKQGKVKIVCFDEEEATLQAVQDDIIQVTVVQKPFEFGYQSVKVLTALARNEDAGIPENKIIDTGVTVVDKSNVDEFWAELNRLKGKI